MGGVGGERRRRGRNGRERKRRRREMRGRRRRAGGRLLVWGGKLGKDRLRRWQCCMGTSILLDNRNRSLNERKMHPLLQLKFLVPPSHSLRKLIVAPTEVSFVKQPRQPMDRRNGLPTLPVTWLMVVISSGELWSQNWKEQNHRPKFQSPISQQDRPPTPPPSTHDLAKHIPSPPSSTPKSVPLSPTSTPFIPSTLRNSLPLANPTSHNHHHHPSLLSPQPRRATLSVPHTAEQLLGRLTPDSALSKSLLIPILESPTRSDDDDEFREDDDDGDEDDWSTKVSSPTALWSVEKYMPAWLSSLKISLKTEIYSPHPAGPPPSNVAQAYSRIHLVDVLDSPTLTPLAGNLCWQIPDSGKREFDNRLYHPSQLFLHTVSGVVEIDDTWEYIGDGRFWCGGFVVQYSSRRRVDGDVWVVKGGLRDELAWLESVEVEVGDLERWCEVGREIMSIGGCGGGSNKEVRVGQWRDENGRDVKRELRAEMFI